MLKVKSWIKLILSIILAQSAGAIGSFFTFSAIPTWYVFLNKPFFSPPNWLFGPVWTILYTLIGISFYLIWINAKKKDGWAIKFFIFHLVLNSLWSIIFFGQKNLGLAFFEIILMWSSIVYMIIKYKRINKWSSYLLIPYLLWVSFASLLNYSVWKLNPDNSPIDVFAQDFTFSKARQDYVFTEDNYKKDLFDFNLKKSAYQKNQTLSLKEELRTSLFKFVGSRNDLVKGYLNMIRIKTLESTGIAQGTKETVYSKIDPEVLWYGSRRTSYVATDSVEDIINKSKEEDSRYITDTSPSISFALAHISLGEVKSLKDEHIKLYTSLKSESANLIKLGRADQGLFDRWFTDIDKELSNITETEKLAQIEIDKILGSDEYQRRGGYKKAIEQLESSRASLLRLNGYIKELENVISNKR